MANAQIISLSTHVKSQSSDSDSRYFEDRGRKDRIHRALSAGYRLADHIGARETCAQMLDALAALKAMSS